MLNAAMLALASILGAAVDQDVAGLATGLVPAGSPGRWITQDDYPAESIQRGEFGIVQFRLDVDAKGAVSACHILASSGYSRLDEVTCGFLQSRAHFHAALDGQKTPIPATWTSKFFWILPGANEASMRKLLEQVFPRIDLVVTVRKLPAGYKRAPLLRVRFDGAGAMAACNVELTSGNAALDRAACEQAKSILTAPALTRRINPPPDSRMAVVSFETETPPKG